MVIHAKKYEQASECLREDEDSFCSTGHSMSASMSTASDMPMALRHVDSLGPETEQFIQAHNDG